MASAEETLMTREIAPAVKEDVVFARYSDAYLARAFGLACYILGDPHEAEDATQEAMARAWSARRSLRSPESFDSWFDHILVNTCRERLRRRRRVREIEFPRELEPETLRDFAAVLNRDSIGRALIGLTVDQRTVLVLRYWRDLSLEQIARRLDWPLGTVKSRLHHALASLRERLERDEREVKS
jgi:RNA polymerase sigma-70 factor (ECF subfamily)